MTEGNVLLTSLVQTDGQIKRRPTVFLRRMPGFGDFLVCGISTQLHQEVPGFDEILDDQSDDFAASGLKAPSLVRLGFLAVLPQQAFHGSIGRINRERHKRLLQKLANYLMEIR